MGAANADANKVLIVGAGIGGLALAQILRKQNIPYEIFERDAGLRSRKQGWAIALIECLPNLAKLLPNDLGDWSITSVNAGTGSLDELAVVNAQTGQAIAHIHSGPPNSQNYLLRAGREHFREFLWNHIPVTTNKQFSHYTETPDSVTVHFKDGSSSTGSLLVGADGASSHVRRQLMSHTPDSLPVLSQYIPIIGEAHLSRTQYEPIDRIANAAVVGGAPGFRFMIGKLSVAPDGTTAKYYYAMCFASTDPESDSHWAATAPAADLFAKVLEYAHELPPILASVIHISGQSGIVTPPIKFLEFVPPTDLPTGRVALLGDAAHAMIPFRGAGANTAVKDACDLGELVIGRGQRGWSQVVDQYNAVMLQRGREMVLSSRQAGQGMEGIMGVAEGRTATRTYVSAPVQEECKQGVELEMEGSMRGVAVA